MSIKRNTTSVILVRVGKSLDDIRSIEFLFKKEKSQQSADLLRRDYKHDNIEIYNDKSDSTGFTMLLKLTPEETNRLPIGVIYMDTRLVLTDGTIPNTKISEINVTPTLFSEVYSDD